MLLVVLASAVDMPMSTKKLPRHWQAHARTQRIGHLSLIVITKRYDAIDEGTV